MERVQLFLEFIGWAYIWALFMLSGVGLVVSVVQIARQKYITEYEELSEYYHDCKVEFYLALVAFVSSVLFAAFDVRFATYFRLWFNATIYSLIMFCITWAYFKYPATLLKCATEEVMQETEEEEQEDIAEETIEDTEDTKEPVCTVEEIIEADTEETVCTVEDIIEADIEGMTFNKVDNLDLSDFIEVAGEDLGEVEIEEATSSEKEEIEEIEEPKTEKTDNNEEEEEVNDNTLTIVDIDE